MTAQIEMSLFARDQGARAWDSVLAAVKVAVDQLTLKEAAFLLDTSPSQLSDALAERDRKSVRAEWLVTLLVGTPPKVRDAIMGELARVSGYKKPERAEKLTDKRRAEILTRAIARLAPGLEAAIDAELEAEEGGRR